MNDELKTIRNRLGLSVTEAAARVGVSARTWERWEAGTRHVPKGVLILLRMIEEKERA